MDLELSSQESMNAPICIIVGFQQKDRQDSQNLKKDKFLECQLLVFNVLLGRKILLILA